MNRDSRKMTIKLPRQQPKVPLPPVRSALCCMSAACSQADNERVGAAKALRGASSASQAGRVIRAHQSSFKVAPTGSRDCSVSVSYVSGHLKTGTLLICIPSQNDMLIHCCVTLKMAAMTLPVFLFIITTRLNVGQDWRE